MTEFQVDTDPVAPVRPQSVIALKLQEFQVITPEKLRLKGSDHDNLERSSDAPPELRGVLSRVLFVIPSHVMMARYLEGGAEEWEVVVGSCNCFIRAQAAWLILRAFSSVVGGESVSLAGETALSNVADDDRILVTRRGSRLMMLKVPATTSLDTVSSLVSSWQF